MSRPRLIETGKFHRCRDRDLSRLRNITVVETIKNETSEFGSRLIAENLLRLRLIETEKFFKMVRPRLIETGKFYKCRDRDSSRLKNFIDVEV